MAYIVPVHQPTSVKHATRLKFLDPEEDSLVVAKANQLHIYRQYGPLLVLEHTEIIYGRITALQRVHPKSSAADHLLVATDRFVYFTLSWDPVTKSLRTETSFVDTADQGARPSRAGTKALIDPTGRIMVLEFFEGIITAVPIVQASNKTSRRKLQVGELGEPATARISELYVRSAAFLHVHGQAKLALLWEDGHGAIRLLVKRITYTGGSSSEPAVAEIDDIRPSTSCPVDHGSSHIIPLPQPLGGLLVLGHLETTYMTEDLREHKTQPLKEATTFVAWVELQSNKYLLADDYGRLFFLTIQVTDDSFQGAEVEYFADACTASVLVNLGSSLVFLGSNQGDSQVLCVDVEDRSLEVIQRIPSIAPICDFTIMDMGGGAGDGQTNEYSSGQARVVTGSGSYQDGSIRSVRSGVGLEDQGILGEIAGIEELFSLSTVSAPPLVDTAVVCFINETRIFQFDEGGGIEELESFKNFELTEGTLWAGNLPKDQLIQITPSFARLIDREGGLILSEWKPQQGRTITNASANVEKVVLAVEGIELVVLDIGSGLSQSAKKDLGSENQISCVAISSMPLPVCFVGLWQTAAVSVLKLDDLESIYTEIVGGEDKAAVPRNLLLTQLLEDQSPTLFVAMADGVVLNFSLNLQSFTLSNKKSIILGTQEAKFRALSRGSGLFNVFAMCEHPSLIYGSEGRAVFAAVTAEKATSVCPFNSATFPNCIMIATAADLRVALVDETRRTHVKDLQLQETVRRLAYSPPLKAFALGTIKRSLSEYVEVVQSHVKLVDEVNFKLLDTYDLHEGELVESLVRAEMADEHGELGERYLVGTGYLQDDQEGPVRGRILIFEVSAQRTLKLVAEKPVKGSCRCLEMMDGRRVVAALVKSVVVFLLELDSPRPKLVRTASFRTSTAPVDIAVRGNTLAIADIMKSISIVEFIGGELGGPDKLVETAHHYQSVWSTAVAHIDAKTYLESDAEGNLLVLSRNESGVTEDDRKRLEITSEMRLGEIVNRIRTVDVPVAADAVVIPRAYIGTVDGSIYLFATISPSKQDLLMKLQANLARFIKGPGNFPFDQYRAYRSRVRQAGEPFRFVDGQHLEMFLSCSEAFQESIVQSLGVEVDEVRGLVERLRRLH